VFHGPSRLGSCLRAFPRCHTAGHQTSSRRDPSGSRRMRSHSCSISIKVESLSGGAGIVERLERFRVRRGLFICGSPGCSEYTERATRRSALDDEQRARPNEHLAGILMRFSCTYTVCGRWRWSWPGPSRLSHSHDGPDWTWSIPVAGRVPLESACAAHLPQRLLAVATQPAHRS
jgi:hypothetical protein